MTSWMTYGRAEAFEEHQVLGLSGRKDTAGRGCKLEGVFGMWAAWSGFPIEYG